MAFTAATLAGSGSQLITLLASARVGIASTVPVHQIWPRLSNRILQRSRNGEGGTNAQSQAQNAAVQFPQPVFEPISSGQALDARASRNHGRLVREQAIDDECVYANDGSWSGDDIDAEPDDGHAFLDGERVVEGVVVEGEVLVERWDFVDNSEGSDQDTAGALGQLGTTLAGDLCAILHDDEVVDDVSALVSHPSDSAWPRGAPEAVYAREDDALR